MEDILDTLRKKSKEQGYITFDQILDITDTAGLDLSSVEHITGRLIDEEIVVLENKPIQETGKAISEFDDVYDKSQIDYEEVFSEVLRIAPQLATYISIIRGIRPPRKGEEKRLISLAQDGNAYASIRLTRMFLKVVIRIALNYHKRYGMPLEDTIQAGNLGLIISIKKYKRKPGRKFSHYAPWWIQQKIWRNAEGIWLNVRIPFYVKDELLKISRFVGPRNLIAAHGNLDDILSIDEIANGTSLKKDKIRKYAYLFKEPCSIETLIDHSTEEPWERSLEYDLSSSIYIQTLLESMESGSLEHELTERDKVILRLRSGLSGKEPMTLQEIADVLGLSRERIRQLLKGISEKLQKFIGIDERIA